VSEPAAAGPEARNLVTKEANSTSNMSVVTDKRNLIQDLYSDYVVKGGDGKDVLRTRGSCLGYDEVFLSECGLGSENTELFQVSCGSGCPLRLAPDGIKEGCTILDLGCGAGHDVVLASRMVGESGQVIGLDMTEAMINAANENVEKYAGDKNCGKVSFVCAAMDVPGDVEKHLEEKIADVVISNGVFNLCDDKKVAMLTAHRALKTGGFFLLSDVNKVEKNENAAATCSIGGDSWAN
jgi:SAM-dependent methyltransferase